MSKDESKTTKYTLAEFGYVLKKACRTQAPEKWEGEKDAWISGYTQAIEDNIRIAGEFLTGGRPMERTQMIFTPEQVAEIEAMITNRLVDFHEALIERYQISPPSALSRMVVSTRPPPPELRVIKNEE